MYLPYISGLSALNFVLSNLDESTDFQDTLKRTAMPTSFSFIRDFSLLLRASFSAERASICSEISLYSSQRDMIFSGTPWISLVISIRVSSKESKFISLERNQNDISLAPWVCHFSCPERTFRYDGEQQRQPVPIFWGFQSWLPTPRDSSSRASYLQ